jgi:hypothetical protein
MKNADKITPQDALVYAEEEFNVSVSLVTMHEWCKKYKIGNKVVGRWQVNKRLLKLLLEGKSWDTNGD